jgi:hypothetical protein
VDAAAADVRLTDDDLRRLDEAAPVGATARDRYADTSSVHRWRRTTSPHASGKDP